ncbi:MAG: nitroreductase family protein [Aeromonadaceae bacterium]
MSNPTLTLLEQRRSERNFTGETIPEADLQTILKAAQQAPTSVNGQQISLVVVRDKNTIAKIAELAGGQPQVATADTFIAIVIDYQRATEAARLAGQPMVIDSSAEGLMVGAVDAGIMLQALQTAAGALGYGTTAIGAVRRDPQAMIELLGLPPKTFVAVGTTLGVIDKSKQAQVKPRVPLESFALRERYDLAAVQKGVAEYDATLRQWWDEQGLTQMPSYAASTAGYYQTIYFPKVAATLSRQGFAFKDE